ncbi:MAG: hypothetical protein ACRCT1_00850 [Microcoleaceae cyanobacterium]
MVNPSDNHTSVRDLICHALCEGEKPLTSQQQTSSTWYYNESVAIALIYD